MERLAEPLIEPPKLSVDAVTASVDAPLEVLVDTLCKALGGSPETVRPLPKRGYDSAIQIAHSGSARVLARVEWGSRFPKPAVYAEGTESYNAPALYAALVNHFDGAWRPSRLDVALDFTDPVMFDVLDQVLVEFALRSDIQLGMAGDWTRGKARTRYLYSRVGQFFLRLYEYRDHHGYGPAVRLELEIKPPKRSRAALAALDPWRMLFHCPATYHALKFVGLDDGPRLALSPGPRAPTSVERDLAYITSAAWPAFLRIVASCDGDIAAAVQKCFEYRAESDLIRSTLEAERNLAVIH